MKDISTGRPQGENEVAAFRAVSRFAARHFWVLSVVVGAVCSLVMVRASRGGGFRHDDFYAIGIAQDYGLSIKTLIGEQLFGSFIPGYMFLNWLVSALGPRWWEVQVFDAVCVAALTVVTAVVVRRLCASAFVALLSALATGTSAVVVETGMWLQSATQLLALTLVVLTILFSLQWFEQRKWPRLLLAVAAQLAAVFIFPTAMLAPLVVWLLLAVAQPARRDISWREAWKRTLSAWPLLAALVAVVALQLVASLLLVGNTSSAVSGASRVPLGDLVGSVEQWWAWGVSSVLSNTFGHPASTSPGLARAVGCGTLLILALFTIRSRRAAVVWVGLATTVTLSGLQIASGRLAEYGADAIASTVRYQLTTVVCLAIFIPAAWATSGRPQPRSKTSALVLGIVAAALIASWVVNFRDGIRETRLATVAAGQFAANFNSSLRPLAAAGDRYTLLDAGAPATLVSGPVTSGNYGAYSIASRILAPGVRVPALNRISGVPLQVDSTGTVRAVRLGPTVQVGPGQAKCGRAAPRAGWVNPKSFVSVGSVPLRLALSANSLLLSVSLSRPNGKGALGITSSMVPSLPIGSFPLKDYPHGARVVMPAGTRDYTVQFWYGAGACIDTINVAEILPP